ncbi:hypothetical protein J1N10_17785 [Carboxylicivirga sp. A043]|uniref:hypothetical protein n=1 Tax=Carboxylicivirga litoralis TaxID=2816963 RepID=UPI0021CB60BF|nr:hypothetical protein [Carboxylicivirga sp. A043]MCU4157830.1 hypothetical protein [Carboxylicivirga sp. A043]
MKFFILNAFIISIAKSGLLICLGLIIMNHFESTLSLISRKPLSDNLIQPQNLEALNKVLKWVGICIIVLGISMAINGLATIFVGMNMPSKSFNFNF